jgi:hypothetical protein
MGAGQPAFRSVGFPTAVVVLAFLPVLSRLGVDLSRKTAVVMVIVVVVVTVVIVGVLGLLVVPMLLRRVMFVRSFMVVMCGVVCQMAARETRSGVKTRDRGPRCPGQESQESSSIHL